MTVEEILPDIAQPELYILNIFRITELPVDAVARDLSRRQATIKQALDIGMAIPPGYGRILPSTTEFDANAFSTTIQQFEDPVRRLVNELFWFWPQHIGESRQDEALLALGRGEIESVYQRWQRERDLPADQGTALHNLAVLRHLQALDGELAARNREMTNTEQNRQYAYWQEAFTSWKNLLENEAFWSRVTARIRDLDDPRLTTGMVPRFRAQLPETLLFINARMAVSAAERNNARECQRQLDLIFHSGFDKKIMDEVLHQASKILQERLATLYKTIDEQMFADHTQGKKLAYVLLDQAEPMLKTLDMILPVGDTTREGIHDKIADCALTATLIYGNKTDDWLSFQPLVSRIEPLIAGKLLRTRLDQNREGVKQILDSLLCWFCRTRYAEKKAAYEIKMYGNVRRYVTGYNRRRIEWQNLRVNVGRCTTCKNAHELTRDAKNVGKWIGFFVSLAASIAIAYAMVSSVPQVQDYDYYTQSYITRPGDATGAVLGGLVIGFLLIALCVYAGGSIGKGIGEGKHLQPKKVRAEENARSHPTVDHWIKQGWTIGERPST